MKYSQEYTIETEQLDPDYRHLHHAEILKVLEKCRLDFLKALDFPQSYWFERQLFLVLTHIEVDYLREVYDGTVVVNCEYVGSQSRRIALRQQLLRADQKMACRAELQFAVLSRELGRAIIIPEELETAFEAYSHRPAD